MTTNFLHGVETVEIKSGARQIRQVKTAVIALIGTAPVYQVAPANQSVNAIKLVLSDKDATTYFGVNTSGYSIPKALRAIYDYGYGTCVVVNIFDILSHNTTVTANAISFATATDTLQLGSGSGDSFVARPGIVPYSVSPSNAAPVITHTSGSPTYTDVTDYTVNYSTGVVTRVVGGAITSGQSVKCTFKYADPSKCTASSIIQSPLVDGSRQGIDLFLDTFSRFGFNPKIYIAPSFSNLAGVAVKMLSLADQTRGIALIDSPLATSYAKALTARGSESDFAGFRTSSDRAVLLYPPVYAYDNAPGVNGYVVEPYSSRYAGAMARRDNLNGYWYSVSNTELLGVTGLERPLTSAISGAAAVNSEVNLLNGAGITTIFNSFGTGYRIWGNRSAAYPTDTHPLNFIPIRRVCDVVAESVEYSMLQFIDLPISDGLIQAICDSVNSFLRTLIGRGALMLGSKCFYDPNLNDVVEISAGHLVFSVNLMPPPPLERITFNQTVDVNLLASLQTKLRQNV